MTEKSHRLNTYWPLIILYPFRSLLEAGGKPSYAVKYKIMGY